MSARHKTPDLRDVVLTQVPADAPLQVFWGRSHSRRELHVCLNTTIEERLRGGFLRRARYCFEPKSSLSPGRLHFRADAFSPEPNGSTSACLADVPERFWKKPGKKSLKDRSRYSPVPFPSRIFAGESSVHALSAMDTICAKLHASSDI